MKKYLYKFLRDGLKSEHGNCVWKIGEWKKEEKISMCGSGFHASQTPLQALGYVRGEIIAQVEVQGTNETESDKEVWSEMRIIKAWKWTKKDSVELAIYSAELVIDIFEKKYPTDKRPREAIEAAKNWLKDPTEKNSAYAAAAAAASAAAAYAAAADADAAAAAYAAAAAAAAYAAAAAAAADADAAAAYAARKVLISKINKWFIKKLKTLPEHDK